MLVNYLTIDGAATLYLLTVHSYFVLVCTVLRVSGPESIPSMSTVLSYTLRYLVSVKSFQRKGYGL